MVRNVYKIQTAHNDDMRVLAVSIIDAIQNAQRQVAYPTEIQSAELFDSRDYDSLHWATQYALMHGGTIAEAIGDRDFAATEKACEEWFEEATGKKPTKQQMETMHPEASDYSHDFEKA